MTGLPLAWAGVRETPLPSARHYGSASTVALTDYGAARKIYAQLSVTDSAIDALGLVVKIEDSVDDGSSWNTLITFTPGPLFTGSLLDDYDDPFGPLLRISWVVTPSSDNDVQTVTVDALAGTFTLTVVNGPIETTDDIAFDASALVVQQAIEALPTVARGDVSVTGADGGPWAVEWVGSVAGTDVNEMTADDTNLSGGTATATVSTDTEGNSTSGGFEFAIDWVVEP